MGGVGSGTWTRRDKKITTANVRRLDVSLLSRKGALGKQWPFGWKATGTISWSKGSEPTGSIDFEVDPDRLRIFYRVEMQYVEETVWLDRTHCHYGGMRLWFSCPKCDRRVGALYVDRARFLCRQCQKLPYASQQESYLGRMQRKARKLRTRLGASGKLIEPIWEKPKGMHWNTFERLRKRERAASTLGMLSWMHEAEALLGSRSHAKHH